MSLQEKRRLKCGPYFYFPDEPLGQGSFAEVFKGVDPEGRTVAIKRIAKSKLTRANNQRLLQSEITILQDLRHPNIVQLLDNQETPDFICLIMEVYAISPAAGDRQYCEGGDLGGFISRAAPVAEDVILRVLQQIGRHPRNSDFPLTAVVDALNYLGSRNIVHRDLKPQNILLRPNDTPIPTVKLADFGFARHLVQEDLAATFCGSPLYMAPEVLEGDSYNASADLWSTGAIIYQCLTGVAPFRAQSIKALKEMLHAVDGPLIPSNTSPELRSLLLGLLRVDPAARLSLAQLTAHPFLTAKQSSESTRPQAARPSSPLLGDSLVLDSASKVLPAPCMHCGSSLQDVDDRSYVLIDPGYVEVNTLADSMERRMRLAPSGLGRNPSDLVSMLDSINHKAVCSLQRTAAHRQGAILSIAHGRVLSHADNILAASVHTPIGRLQARGEALLLYVKALSILRSGLANLRSLIGRSSIALTPPLVAAVQTLRSRFNDCASRIETIRAEMTPAVLRSIRGSAEQLLHRHAVTLSRDAASKEACANYASSEVLYSNALTLLETVLLDAKGQEATSIHALLAALRERHSIVAQKSASQDRYLSSRPPLAVTLEDSPGNPDIDPPTPVTHAPQVMHQHTSTQLSRRMSPSPQPEPHVFTRTPSDVAPPALSYVPLQAPPPSMPIYISQPSRHAFGELPVAATRTATELLLATSPPGMGQDLSTGGSPPQTSPLPSPGLKKAAFCGNCGNGFNSEAQRFCMHCGAARAGLGESTSRISSSPS